MTQEEMNVLRVDVTEHGKRARKGWMHCEEDANVAFTTERLRSYVLGNWEPVIYDAFLLAAAVEFCDVSKRRAAYEWGRQFELRVPVHDVELWNGRSVSHALHGALEFLTGDRWTISFHQRARSIDPPQQQAFALPTGAMYVLPHSEGLDSYLVAGLMEREHGENLVRVRLGSKSLGEDDSHGRKRPFATVPYQVRVARRVEATARSRGFKFAMLSGMAAYLVRGHTVVVPESGQGALGPSLVPVGQAYEDYRNHPAFTAHMETFFAALLGHKVQFEFPRLWFTKGQTLRAFVELTGDNIGWRRTRSCWQDNRQVSLDHHRYQCGICAACMLRRLSVHAAGLEEKAGIYIWENLRARNFHTAALPGLDERRSGSKAQLQYAIAGTLHLDHLAALADSRLHREALESKAFQLARTLGKPEADVLPRLRNLLKQHATEWKGFTASLGDQSFIMDWAEAA